MKRLQSPKGRDRTIDLLSQRSGVYTFGSRARTVALAPVYAQFQKVIWILVLAGIAGIVLGVLTKQLIVLACIIGGMILITLVFGVRELIDATPAEGSIVVDANRCVVQLPPDSPVGGEVAMEDLNLIVAPGDDAGHPDRQCWFVFLEGSAGEDATGSWRYSVSLFGPGNRPDMLAFAAQLGHLGPWRSVQRL